MIAGRTIPDKVADNTVINLPGLGSVTVKFVNAVTYGNVSAGVEVEMLRIQITTSNSLGLPVGTTLVVGEAFAGYARTALKAALTGLRRNLGRNRQYRQPAARSGFGRRHFRHPQLCGQRRADRDG